MTPLERAADRWHKANTAVEDAKEGLADAIRAALNEGLSEREIARQAGINRLTVRRILGKG
jgi:DNA invertase Pin-like site-specific DNA recombinase